MFLIKHEYIYYWYVIIYVYTFSLYYLLFIKLKQYLHSIIHLQQFGSIIWHKTLYKWFENVSGPLDKHILMNCVFCCF